MPLRFVDSAECDGWIADDLSLPYVGPAETTEAIERSIADIEVSANQDDDVLGALIVELPADCEIREIERVDGHSEVQ